MRVSEIRVNQIRVNQGLGVLTFYVPLSYESKLEHKLKVPGYTSLIVFELKIGGCILK